jgi:hypothetical protein
MICHVCHEQAVGQCKKCGKFYCAAHGDVECVTCREALQKTPAPPAIDVRLPEYGGPAPQRETVYVGTTCYACSQPAAGACAKCGRFCCAAHRGQPSALITNPSGLCQPCQEEANTRATCSCVWVAFVLVVMGVVFVIMFSQFHW